MKFKFRLETVLKHRKRLEEAAQKEFAEAQDVVNAAHRQLEAMYNRLDEVRDEIGIAIKSSDPKKLEHIHNMEQFMFGQKVKIESKRLEIRELLLISEEKQEALIHAAQERKILDKLKEKRRLEHIEVLKRIDQKIQDDQTSMSQAWGKR